MGTPGGAKQEPKSPCDDPSNSYSGHDVWFQDPQQGLQQPSNQHDDAFPPVYLDPQYTPDCESAAPLPWGGFPPIRPYADTSTMPNLHEYQQVGYYRQYPYYFSYGSYYPPFHASYKHMEQYKQPANDVAESEGAAQKNPRRKAFPEKLMKAFMEFPNEEAVSWLKDGKSFAVVNQDLFVSEVLNKVFRTSKYTSFTRKLHRWGFVRLARGTGADCFYHPLFTINKPELSATIKCPLENKKLVLTKSSKGKPSLTGLKRFIRSRTPPAIENRKDVNSPPPLLSDVSRTIHGKEADDEDLSVDSRTQTATTQLQGNSRP